MATKKTRRSAAAVLEVQESNAALLDQIVGEFKKRDRTQREIDFDVDQRKARLYAASGLWTDLKNMGEDQAIAACFVKMQFGRDLGLNETQSLGCVVVIEGKPTVDAAGRGLLLKKAGYDWVPKYAADGSCTLVKITKRGKPLVDDEDKPITVAFTMKDAETAELTTSRRRDGSSYKGNYQKYARNMCNSRAVTNFQRWYAPEVLDGNILDPDEAIEVAANEREEADREEHSRATVDFSKFKPAEPPVKPGAAARAAAAEEERPQATAESPSPADETNSAPEDAPPALTENERPAAKRKQKNDAATSAAEDPVISESKAMDVWTVKTDRRISMAQFREVLAKEFGVNNPEQLRASQYERAVRRFQNLTVRE